MQYQMSDENNFAPNFRVYWLFKGARLPVEGYNSVWRYQFFCNIMISLKIEDTHKVSIYYL